jgi:hypothetical protein
MTAERVTERDGRMFIAVSRRQIRCWIPIHHRLEPLIQQRLAQTKPSDRLVASPRGCRGLERFHNEWKRSSF